MSDVKVKYKPNGETELWNYINLHQDQSIESMAKKFSIDEKQMGLLVIHWAAGQQGKFNKLYFSLFDGAPTSF